MNKPYLEILDLLLRGKGKNIGYSEGVVYIVKERDNYEIKRDIIR